MNQSEAENQDAEIGADYESQNPNWNGDTPPVGNHPSAEAETDDDGDQHLPIGAVRVQSDDEAERRRAGNPGDYDRHATDRVAKRNQMSADSAQAKDDSCPHR